MFCSICSIKTSTSEQYAKEEKEDLGQWIKCNLQKAQHEFYTDTIDFK